MEWTHQQRQQLQKHICVTDKIGTGAIHTELSLLGSSPTELGPKMTIMGCSFFGDMAALQKR